MNVASYQSPGGQPVARPLPPALLPAVLLIVAGTLAIISSFLTVAVTTSRLLGDNSYFADHHSTVDVGTSTAWSMTFTVPSAHQAQPLDGWGLVLGGAVALLVAVLLLAGRGRWAWTKPLAALASGLLVGVLVMAVLTFVLFMSQDFADSSQSLETSAGPAVWLQIPAGLLAIVVAILAMSGGRRPPATPPRNAAMPQSYYAAPPAPYPSHQQTFMPPHHTQHPATQYPPTVAIDGQGY